MSLATEQDEKVRNEIEMLKKELTEQNLKMPTNFTSSIVSRDSDLESNLSTSDYFKPTLPRRSSSFRSMKQILRRRLAKWTLKIQLDYQYHGISLNRQRFLCIIVTGLENYFFHAQALPCSSSFLDKKLYFTHLVSLIVVKMLHLRFYSNSKMLYVT